MSNDSKYNTFEQHFINAVLNTFIDTHYVIKVLIVNTVAPDNYLRHSFNSCFFFYFVFCFFNEEDKLLLR